MESSLHMMQVLVLLESLMWHWRDRDDYFASGNLTIYYSLEQVKARELRGPDVFVVQGVDPRPRRSWAVWEEGGRTPDVIVEVLSDSTAANDRGPKKLIYERTLRTPESLSEIDRLSRAKRALGRERDEVAREGAFKTPPSAEYFLFDPETAELEGFRLSGGRYRPIEADAAGRLASEQLELSLGVHEGQLRFFTAAGALIERGSEAALAATARAREATARSERLAAALRAAGIDPDTVA